MTGTALSFPSSAASHIAAIATYKLMVLSTSSFHDPVYDFWQTKMLMRPWTPTLSLYSVFEDYEEAQFLIDSPAFADKVSLVCSTCATLLCQYLVVELGSSLELLTTNSPLVFFSSGKR